MYLDLYTLLLVNVVSPCLMTSRDVASDCRQPRSPHLWLSGGFHWTNAEGVAGLLWISRCTGRENFSTKAVFRGPRFSKGEIMGFNGISWDFMEMIDELMIFYGIFMEL